MADFSVSDYQKNTLLRTVVLVLTVVPILGWSRQMGIYLKPALGKIKNPVNGYSCTSIEPFFGRLITLESCV